MRGGSQVTYVESFSLEYITGAVKVTVVEGSEADAEGEVVEVASEEAVAGGVEVEGVSQPQEYDLKVQTEFSTDCQLDYL